MRVGLWLVAVVVLQAVVGSMAAAKPPDPLTQPCPASTCGASCPNETFKPTSCATTPCGPARANIVIGNALASTNMLWCPGGRPYALCFFSGPPHPTGNTTSYAINKTLSCVVNPRTGIADCQCQVYNKSAYYVDINSILNLNVWYETTASTGCGADGSGCKNIRDCDGNGQTKAGSKTPCPSKVAPVCDYVNNQGSGAPLSQQLYPDAGTADLVSTFSFSMSGSSGSTAAPYTLGSTPCTGLYAGCMTAPCKYPPGKNSGHDGSIVNCACPTWTGTYQVGQNGQTCDLKYPDLTFVWSAANSVPSTSACTSTATGGAKPK